MSAYNRVCTHMCVHVFERPDEHKDKFNIFPYLKCRREYKTRNHEVAQGVKVFASQTPAFNPHYLHVKRRESPTQTSVNMLWLKCVTHTHTSSSMVPYSSPVVLQMRKVLCKFQNLVVILLDVNLGVVDSPS